ncbi:hypothetical protein [Chryseobacterium lathyri]|uniref:hypothetical protein n=1 Tax=Chryseobacterium lathyri TaxID=395933 RepID=UPI002787DCAF|nr:hypothetical protein [Chryseobacterium lathyri]MDQ0065759.1 hypothetical protein [Chryseobacterium lathyri]
MKKQNLFLFLLLFLGNMILYAQCSVNAGGNQTICGTSYTLQGSSGSTGTPTWTLVSKPSGAPDPVISNVNSLTPNVTGMTSPGNYVFQVEQDCGPSGSATSQVTITAPGGTSTFTAGPDITNVNATTGTVTLNGVVPAGYTASWTAYNIYRWERSSIKTNQNSQFSSTTSATTTFSLINKANHDIDPAYVVTLRITSTINPSCWYEDTAIVRFIPNPQILPTVSTSKCNSSGGSHFISLQSTSPKFSKGYPTSPGSSGNFGTTVTMNVISQPSGGNIAYSNIYDDNIFFNGVNVTGVYKFTLTITNASGTFTTPELTYTYNGVQPNPVNFLVSSRPEQMMIYDNGNSGGEVHCGYAGQSTPITFYYSINPADNPATIDTSVASSGIIPPGGAPVVTNGGAGTATRSATVTPPAGGWRVGTYKFVVTRNNAGACSAIQFYFIHISDGSRPNVTVPNTTVCYPGSGVVTATIPLPAVYKGVVNTSYFQEFDGRYRLTLVSKPAGAADPIFEPYANTLFTNTSTTISNLNMPGEYVFKIKADTYNPSVGAFLNQEYACSGASLESNFSVFVAAQVGANAGSTQTLIGTSQTTFNANNPGVATGAWTLLTKPVGATDPVIAAPTAYNTNVTGFNTPGTYTFRWTVTTGGTCSSTSDLTVNVINAAAGGVSGADFWVKSDDAGTIATAWKDHSINANDIPAVGTWTLSAADRNHNFNPYTTGYSASKFFYNSTSVMNSTNGELANTNTSIFSAVRPTTNGTGRITGIDDDATYASEPGVSIANGDPRQYEYFNTITSTDFSTTFNIGISNIFSAIANNSVANGGTSASPGGEKILGLNGSYQTTPFTGTNKFQIYGRNLRIGHAGWDAPGAFPGDIMEVVWYKRTLTANEQSRVNSYLAVKNGVTLNTNYLSTNSNVVWDRTVNTGYNNNIFGIARDNITVLHQKQSGSINNGQKLVISTTGFADNNIANATGLANDLQYLMTGDNGLKQSFTVPLSYTAGSNGATNYRFESIWKVQNSGNVGNVTVAWPKGAKNLYLVQSSDAVFDGTDTFTPMTTEVTVNGVVYNTVNVTLSNGQFFTFAGFGNAPGGVATGLSYWYRADVDAANTGVGTDVTAWKDVWNGTTVAQLGTNALPKYAIGTSSYFNYNPGINFTAVSQTLGNINVQTVSALEFDIFTLTKENILGNGANNRLFSSLVNNSLPAGSIERWDGIGLMTDQGYPNFIERVNNAYGARYLANPGNISRSTTIPSIMYHRFTDLAISKGLNGAASGSNGTHTARGLMNGGHAFGDTRFSSNGSDNGGFTGHIGETIIYGAGNLSSTERRKVDSYLAIKYGITLGQLNTDHYLGADGTFVWNGGTNTAFNNNIFGVAREDIGLFEQKVSTSVNAGTILTVATVNDFVNPNNTASRTGFTNDKTYFLLGDNNITTTALSSITINGFTGGSRIPKIWLAQRTNTSGTMYFGADLSSYGAGFGSGDHVKMIIADDAAFTTNVEYVDGTYDATIGKWVHSHNFDSENVKRYITYAVVDEVSCTTGCNDNAYLNATNPNTIEYDNLVAGSSAILAKEKDGTFKIWGYRTGPTSTPSNANVPIDLLVPTAITPANGFNYTGTPLKATLVSASALTNSALLTTDGLYTWGDGGYVISNVHKDTNTGLPAFSKVTVNGKADGLPPGVSPINVKMMFGVYTSLVIVTCSGEAWVLTSTVNQNYYGDGMPATTANTRIWHRVKISATETLDNVVAVRGNDRAKFALTSDGKLYTWGLNTFIGDGTDVTNGTPRAFATEVTVPNGITPKMIGMTGDGSSAWSTYFLLATNGKLFTMGSNNNRMLGDGTTTNNNVWKEVTATSGGHTLGGNIVWISPSEAGYTLSPAINVLTNDKKQWGWGSNLDYKLGLASSSSNYDPTYMPGNTTNINGMGLSDEIIALETGGRFTMNYKNSNSYFGIVGSTDYGTMGNGSTGIQSQQKYTYNTAILDVCMLAPAASVCYKPGITAGTTLDTKAGITALNRAGVNADNWPMVRKGGWLALESKTKGFVPNRVAFSGGNPVGIAPANFVEGMMVYDTTNKCMKMYTLKDGDTSMAWHCITTQTCPD